MVNLVKGGSNAKGNFQDKRKKPVKPLSARGNTKTTPSSPTRENAAKLNTQSPTPPPASAPPTSSGGSGGTIGPASLSEKKGLIRSRLPHNQLLQGAIEGITASNDPSRDIQTLPAVTGLGIGLGAVAGEAAGLGKAGKAGRVTKQVAQSKLVAGGIEKLLEVGKYSRPGAWSKYADDALQAAQNAGRSGSLSKVTTNSKVIAQTKKILQNKFSKKVMLGAGAWAGAVFLGKWGQAESSEPMKIYKNKYLVPYAMETGDWSYVDEANEIADELIDQEWWKDVALWSPISPFVGIPLKIKGAAAALRVEKKWEADIKIQQETGESDDDKYARIRQEQLDADKAAVDYFNQERKKMLEFQRQAEVDARNADAVFWAKERRKQDKLEEKEREAIADFWSAYHKQEQDFINANRASDWNYGSSSLNFGLLK